MRRDQEHRDQPSLFDSPTMDEALAQPAPHNGVDTSREAAEAIEPHLNRLQKSVLAFLRSCGGVGATDEQMQLALEMSPSTQRPRRIELFRNGLIELAPFKRQTKSGRSAQVWRVKA